MRIAVEAGSTANILEIRDWRSEVGDPGLQLPTSNFEFPMAVIPIFAATDDAFGQFGSSAKISLQAAWRAIRSIESSGRVVARGTVMAPIRSAPSRTNTHCGVFSI